MIGTVGDDEPGRALLSQLKASRVNCDGVVVSPQSHTTTKVRILAGQVHSTRQQVIRVDYEGAVLADPKIQESFCASLRDELPGADASIISDYNYGVAGDDVTHLLQEMRRARKHPDDCRFSLSLRLITKALHRPHPTRMNWSTPSR
ncbi:MAG: PfkB family carbohydrate kinase [Pyrinomonadaceae bacterium]